MTRAQLCFAARLAGATALAASLVAGTSDAGALADTAPAAIEKAGAGARAARLWVGFAEVLGFERTVGTIVVGDAGVIDATVIDERTVVLTALSAGRTNVVVLGQDGEVLARLSVVARAPAPPSATVYRGSEGTILLCDPECLPGKAAATSRQAE